MLKLTIDGPRYATAYKATQTTIGTDRHDPDTNQIMWIELWENEGIQLATFDGMRTTVAYIPQIIDDPRPDRHADYQATIRTTQLWNNLAAHAAKDSDQHVTIQPNTTTNTHLPGMEPPPGIQIVIDSIEGQFAATATGTETMHDEHNNWWQYINNTQPATTIPALQASQDTFKKVAAIANQVGNLNVNLKTKDGQPVVHIDPATPACTLGIHFAGLMSWAPTPTEPAQQTHINNDDAGTTSGVNY